MIDHTKLMSGLVWLLQLYVLPNANLCESGGDLWCHLHVWLHGFGDFKCHKNRRHIRVANDSIDHVWWFQRATSVTAGLLRPWIRPHMMCYTWLREKQIRRVIWWVLCVITTTDIVTSDLKCTLKYSTAPEITVTGDFHWEAQRPEVGL